MPQPIPGEVVEAIERLAAQCSGDVPGLVSAARAIAVQPFSDDAVLASAFEEAARRRAVAGDRGAVWWLACAIAMLRQSPFASGQEEAEVNAARALGELARSPAAVSGLPQGACWIVSGAAEPAPVAQTIELARRNATTYVERLDAELAGRAPMLRAKWEAAPVDSTRAAIDEALATYRSAIYATRAALSRVVDHVSGRTSDAALAESGAAALAELDDVVIPSLLGRIAEARPGAVSVRAPMPTPPPTSTGSFAAGAPPAFRPGTSSAELPTMSPEPTVEELDATMRATFERAWASHSPEDRAAFERAVRARYERDVASMPPAERQQALDHYVAHALSQLPT